MITPSNKNRETKSVKLIVEPSGKVIDFADFINEVIDFEENQENTKSKDKQTPP